MPPDPGTPALGLVTAELFRALAHASNDEMYILRPGGELLWVNDAACASLGYAREDLLKLPVSEFSETYAQVHAEVDHPPMGAVFQAVHVTRDGRRIPKEVRAVQVTHDGERVQLAIARDVSEQRAGERALQRSEQHYRGLFENAHDGILVIDPERTIVIDANPAACEMYGYPRRDFVGLPVSAFAMPDTDIDQRVRAALSQTGSYRFETRHRRRDGSTMDLEIHATGIEHHSGPALLCMHRDLTARHNLEAQLHHGQKMEAVGRLAGGIAHDFNNLLTVISGHAELLLEILGDRHAAHHHADRVLNATRRGAAVARQLLTFSRRSVVSRAVVDLNSVIIDVGPMLRTLIGEDVRLDVRPAGVAVPVNADSDQLEQVIVNMAVNARDAMPSGGVLTVATALRTIAAPEAGSLGLRAPGEFVELLVTDTGSGMPPEVAAKVFEPFFTTKPPGTGTGLGLATAYGIVSQHGGVLAVDSRPGRGTTFTIALPRAEGPAVSRTTSEAAKATGRGSETILLVEDDIDVRMLAKTVLERRGYRVLEADHGRAGLALATRYGDPIHAVVSDVIMPGMNGPEMAATLAAERPDLRVLFISGYADRAREELGSPGPGRAFLAKPFTPRDLATAVRDLLDAVV